MTKRKKSLGKTKAGTERKREPREGDGRPTKYTKELGEEIARLMTHNTIQKTCELVNINPDTYYEWIYKYKDFSEISTEARKTKAIKHFTECENILEEMKYRQDDEDVRADIVRLRLDFHLRLAGKANQGLFGDQAKNNIQVTVDNKDVDVPTRQTQEEWEANSA